MVPASASAGFGGIYNPSAKFLFSAWRVKFQSELNWIISLRFVNVSCKYRDWIYNRGGSLAKIRSGKVWPVLGLTLWGGRLAVLTLYLPPLHRGTPIPHPVAMGEQRVAPEIMCIAYREEHVLAGIKLSRIFASCRGIVEAWIDREDTPWRWPGSQWAGALPRLTRDFAQIGNQLFCFKPQRFRGCLLMWHKLAWLMDSHFLIILFQWQVLRILRVLS